MRLTKILAALAVPLLLTGCFLSPGKFDAAITVNRDGTYSFRYTGELVVADMSGPERTFEPQPCYDEETYEDRECTEADLEQQRREFDDMVAQDKAMGTGFSGPGGQLASDEGIAELVEKLKKQHGWIEAEYLGDRVIRVDYAVSGRLDQPVAFPVIEGQPTILSFLTITRRKDGAVKISAPGFSNGEDAAEMAAGQAGGGGKQVPAQGRFTVTTDGEILTNNTEDGPTNEGVRSVLTWEVTPVSDNAPEALIQTDLR